MSEVEPSAPEVGAEEEANLVDPIVEGNPLVMWLFLIFAIGAAVIAGLLLT